MFGIHRLHLASTIAAVALAGGAAAATGPVQASAATLPAFTCSDKSGGVSGVTGTVTSIRVAHHDGYDRLVIGFATSSGVPTYQLHRQATSTFVRDASGMPATLAGSAGIRAVLRDSDIADGVPSNLTPGLPEIRQVTNIGNFERVVSYGVGLKDQACFRTLELSGPSRLVIDVETPAAPAAVAQASSQPAASTASSDPSVLATTGHPASDSQGGLPLSAIVLVIGLLALTAGAAMLAVRRFAGR